MKCRQPTMIDVLQPRRVKANAARTKVTRTIRQPELDEFERRAVAEAAHTGRRHPRSGAAAKAD